MTEFSRAGDTEDRYIREIVFGKRRNIRYWQITTDSVELPENTTWFIMTNLPGDIQKSVGNTYGLRTWIEYGFKSSLVPGGSLQAWKGRPEGQVKDELGWADYRLTSYEEIEKWWEIVCSACLMVSLQTSLFKQADKQVSSNPKEPEVKFSQHQWWDKSSGWKNVRSGLTFNHPAVHLFSFNPPLAPSIPYSRSKTRVFPLNQPDESVRRLCSRWISYKFNRVLLSPE